MRRWLRGKPGGVIALVAIAALVMGGLGWVTAVALGVEEQQQLAHWRLEQERETARLQADYQAKLRVALWRLDSRVSPILANEASRPYGQYSALYAPATALHTDGKFCPPGSVLEPSPLLNAELPEWILLHFQVDSASGWTSPEVPSPALASRLSALKAAGLLGNVTEARQQRLHELAHRLTPVQLVASLKAHGLKWNVDQTALVPPAKDQTLEELARSPAYDYKSRAQQQARVMNESQLMAQNAINQPAPQAASPPLAKMMSGGGAAPAGSAGASRSTLAIRPLVTAHVSLMTPLWFPKSGLEDELFVTRVIRIGDQEMCQGFELDFRALRALLADEIRDIFPRAQLVPVYEKAPPHPEATMSALPIELVSLIGVSTPMSNGLAVSTWTPLRLGLVLAWTAALIALLAVGLGGWFLIDLSQRRIRFVSAVTHELRTPLTTLRLYLDMLAGGMIQEEARKQEYIQTLNVEADRLNRLVGNVLDFSRLENGRPRLALARTTVAELLEQVRTSWQGRCAELGKDLVVDDATDPDTEILTDVQLVPQVLGNLIDNACKYSRGAEDRRIWLRARRETPRRLVLEVEDRGPGIAPREQRSIFRPFRRGGTADVTAGGVGLGLALAQRWAGLLGGRLTLEQRDGVAGACFRLELPVSTASGEP